MNEKNLASLKKQVMYTGFGNLLDYQLEENMKKDLPNFQLNHKPEFGKDQAEATLNFRKSEQGNYFFNTYDLQLNKEGEAPMKQTFYVNKPDQVVQKVEGAEDKIEWVNSTITLKEAYNMMEGRAVLKDYVSQDNVKYANWANLDLKNADENGNYKIKRTPDFDLEAKLAALPIKELATEESKNNLLDSLRKGNRQSVTILSDGAEHKIAIEANPQFKTINRYESNVRQSANQKETSNQSAKQDQKEGQKDDKGEDGNRKSQKRSSKKHQGLSS